MVRSFTLGISILLITRLNITSCRLTRRHLKRSSDCFNSASSDQHAAFFQIFHKNREEDQLFTSFQPESLNMFDIKPIHKHRLLSTNRQCDSNRVETLPDDALSDRSVCPFHYVLNYKEKRIPQSIPQVECTCQQLEINGRKVFCEPMYYKMRVIEFDESCQEFVDAVERVPIACITVFQNSINDVGIRHNLNSADAPV